MNIFKNMALKSIQSIKMPIVFVLMLWCIFFSNLILFSNGLNQFGIRPRESYGILGVMFSPFLHGNFSHILGNSIFFLLLSWIICFYSHKLWFKSIFYGIFIGGLFTWVFGISGLHIGASGVVFSLWGTILGMAFYNRSPYFLISTIILFIGYTTTFFLGLIPQDGISFSGHLGGALAGILASKGFASYKQVDYNNR
jgi:membrane associated rhomboid family serine protease